MTERATELIELELAILGRHISSMTTYKKISNLERSAYLLLHQIAFCGSAGVKALAEEFHLDVSTVSRQAAALERKGYVLRIPDPGDRRAYFLQLTDLGKRELEENMNARQSMIETLLSSWTAEECQAFGQLLKKFNEAITAGIWNLSSGQPASILPESGE
jgi:DNA-binding MarR family transcriptional regulator